MTLLVAMLFFPIIPNWLCNEMRWKHQSNIILCIIWLSKMSSFRPNLEPLHSNQVCSTQHFSCLSTVNMNNHGLTVHLCSLTQTVQLTWPDSLNRDAAIGSKAGLNRPAKPLIKTTHHFQRSRGEDLCISWLLHPVTAGQPCEFWSYI